MNSKRVWQISGTIALFALVAGVVWLGAYQPSPAQTTASGQTQAGSVSLSIDGLYQNKQIAIFSGETVLQLLRTLNTQDPKLELQTKDYPGLGSLVEGMHGMKNGTDQKYWQYKVNGTEPQVGADAYTLKEGDSVEWFFKASQE